MRCPCRLLVTVVAVSRLLCSHRSGRVHIRGDADTDVSFYVSSHCGAGKHRYVVLTPLRSLVNIFNTWRGLRACQARTWLGCPRLPHVRAFTR